MIQKLVMFDIPAPNLGRETIDHLRQHKPGGIILFRKNIQTQTQTRQLCEDLLDLLGEDLLIAIDQEGGGVWRSQDLPFAPSAMNLGASNDAALAQEMGALTGRGLRGMGINWNFAPVLDVNSNAQNPVISDRSYGENPERVAELALAWSAGLHSAGVASCGKHFPGHGDTSLDSHLALPVVQKTLGELEQQELLPFRQAVAAKMPSLMTSHILFEALDDQNPATLSRAILTGLLREQWGYDGVIVTDSMGMKAITDYWGRGAAAVQSVQAGADMVEALGAAAHQAETLEALERACKDGIISNKNLEASLERLYTLAKNFPAQAAMYDQTQHNTDHERTVVAWGRGITLYGGAEPPEPGSRITLLCANEVPGENVSEVGVPGPELARALREVYTLETIFYDAHNPLASMPQVLAARAAKQNIVFASTSRHRLREETRTLVKEAKPILHLALWNAYSVVDVPAPAIVTYGYRAAALEALLRVLRGEREAAGRSPVTL